MARKPVTVEETVEATEVAVFEAAPLEVASNEGGDPNRPLSPQTLAEMEAGRKALADRAASAKAETEQ
jgi:hypothetical protein